MTTKLILLFLAFILVSVVSKAQTANPQTTNVSPNQVNANGLAPLADADNLSTLMFRGDPQHHAIYKGDGFLKSNYLKWKFHTGGGIASSAAIWNDSVYIGSNDGYLYCLNADSGALRWKFKATAGVSSSPAVHEGLVFFQSNDNRFFAVAAGSGKLKWSFDGGANVPFDGRCVGCASTEEDGWDYWSSSPLVAERSVYFGSGDSHVYCLDSNTGKLRWKFKTGGRVRSSPALDGQTIYVGGMDGVMYALDATSGLMRWKFKTEGNKDFPIGEIQSSPSIDSGTVVFGSRDYHVYGLEAESGKLRWRILHDDSWIVSSPAIASGNVYVGSSDGRFLQKISLLTGQEVWRKKVSLNIYSSPAIAGDYVYAATARGEMIALDQKDGKVAAGFLIDDNIHSSPVISGGVVFFGAENGNLYAIASGNR